MSKAKIILLVSIILNIVLIYLLVSKKQILQKENIVEIEGPIKMQVNEGPAFYKGVTNYLRFEFNKNRFQDIIVKIDSSVINYDTAHEVFEIKVFKLGKSKLELYLNNENGDTIKLYERNVFIKNLPTPIPHLAFTDTLSADHIIDIGRIYCYNSLHGRSEQTFEITNQTMVATVDNVEIEISSNNMYFSEEQNELIKKLKPGQHLLIKDINAILPDSTIRRLKPIIIIIKD